MNSNQPPALTEKDARCLIEELESRRAIMRIDSDKLWEYDWFADKAFEIALMALNAPPVADVVEWNHPTEERKCRVDLRRFDLAPGPLFVMPPVPVQPVSQHYKLPELNEELTQILGRPNFACAGIASVLRKGGVEINRKAEHEQAAVIHFLLGHYLQSGDKWLDAVDKELDEMVAAPEAP